MVALLLSQVLHPALRAARDAVMEAAGKNMVPEVWAVLDKIKAFTGGCKSEVAVCLLIVATTCSVQWVRGRCWTGSRHSWGL